MEGWIKLHRKLLDNEIYIYDPTAWRVFEYFLLIADRNTGKRRFGRNQVSEVLEINPSTLYKAIKRLEKAKMVTLDSNSRFTTLSIVNWHYYQGNGNKSGNSEVTAGEQPGNTKQEVRIKNKEVVYPDNTIAIAKILGVEPTDGLNRYLNEIYKLYRFKNLAIKLVQWCEENKKPPTISRFMNWVRRAEEKGELERRGE